MQTDQYKTLVNSLIELDTFIGQELGVSPWIKIDQTMINTFATVTKDEQWIHTDPVRSQKESPYKKPIAHGFLILSMASKFLEECLTIGNLKMGVNYGFDKIRFMNAVMVDNEIRGRFKLINFETFDGGAKYKMELSIEINGQSKPACVAEWIGIGYF